jgi:hypothetical protein
MANQRKLLLPIALLAVCFAFFPDASEAQDTDRYEPTTPTVSPYLNLFRNDQNGRTPVPNYYALVRPLQNQYRTNQIQQQILQQQTQAISQLHQTTKQLQLEKDQPVVQTGHKSWYFNPGTRTKFRDTSQYYSHAGTGASQQGTPQVVTRPPQKRGG